jgi:carbon-monoxide dehydrogenase medium subunit
VTFSYHEPANVEEATALLAAHGAEATVLAGGTAFGILYRSGLIHPAHVVGLRRCAELRGIRADKDGLWIGALVTHREVERSAAVRAHHAAIADTFGRIATIRIRHQATVGGNLAHADPAQDPPPTLIAFDATVQVAGPSGARREIPVEKLFVDHFTTALADDELILGVRIPPVAAGTRATYLKFLPRSLDDYATVSAAAAIRLDADGRIAFVRVALGAVGPVPTRAHAVEAALTGQRPVPALLADAAALVRDEIDPLDDARGSVAYKKDMARVWTRRALEQVAA